ncbi:MAG: hypothetical protein GWN79_25765, partial [Actinobacteria bacterium]|nr:hypothetical protein [Actinomycetota bacterium]NIV90395.1 hypothetical protein [Actinomycetota bacterium]
YANEAGSAEFDLEPGVDLYHVFVSRGTEYSAYRTPAPISVSAGGQTVVNAQIARVVDTSGFISSDFHVHGIRSADSRVSDVHRVESYTAEGVENVVMTDHHVHTDLKPAIAAAGMESFVTATIGEEITTFDYGHFNAYPLLIDPDSPHGTFTPDGLTQLSGGSTDWAQAAPPGMDFPVYGALNATPAEILSLATTGSLSIPGTTTAQINHIDSHFAPLKIDTSLVPPADLMSDDDRANRRLPDTSAVPNLFAHFPALELWNGNDRGHQSEFLDERIGIWFNHLNQGLRTTFIADTDSHRFARPENRGRAHLDRLADGLGGLDRPGRRGRLRRCGPRRGRAGCVRDDAAAGDGRVRRRGRPHLGRRHDDDRRRRRRGAGDRRPVAGLGGVGHGRDLRQRGDLRDGLALSLQRDADPHPPGGRLQSGDAGRRGLRHHGEPR